MGKSLGSGLYNTRGFGEKEEGDTTFLPNGMQEQAGDAKLLNELYDFMWVHMIGCYKDEFKGNLLFNIISEYKR